MLTERLRYRLGLRSSNAARPYRNRYRERHDGSDWLTEWEAEREVLEAGELDANKGLG